MAKYTFRFHRDAWVDIEVEADSKDEAYEIAADKYNDGEYDDDEGLGNFENTFVDLIKKED